MPDYLTAVMAMLGPAQNRYADPSAWDRLHAELGIRLPTDYQTLVDAYAPIQLNGHLSLHHPATERWNLGQEIRDTIRAWSEVSWDDLDPDEDPRLLFGLTELSFGTRNGLWPIASTDRGETLFLVAADDAAPGLLVEDGEGGWARFEMSFAEWLYRYLVGEDMAGPHSSAFYPGPVQLRRLPMTADERPEPWSGPDRGIRPCTPRPLRAPSQLPGEPSETTSQWNWRTWLAGAAISWRAGRPVKQRTGSSSSPWSAPTASATTPVTSRA